MGDRRRYTGTKTLQTLWTVAVVAVVGGSVTLLPGSTRGLLTVAGVGAVWLAGLLGLGLYGHYRWRRLVAGSSLDPRAGPDTADLQGIRHGQSVAVTAEVPGLFSQTHTTVRAAVEGVSASFVVTIRDADTADDDGLTTGDDAIDDQFVIEGSAENVSVLLTDEVRAALLAVETPGTITATGDDVVFEIPFGRLTPAELDAAADAVAVIAARIEAVARD